MNKNYYVRNVFWGVAGSFILVFDNLNNYVFLLLALVNAFLYPFAKMVIENIALEYTSRKFWEHDFFTNLVGGSMQAIYYLFCYVFSIPLGGGYVLFLIIKNNHC